MAMSAGCEKNGVRGLVRVRTNSVDSTEKENRA
jgi:hypothetical protein